MTDEEEFFAWLDGELDGVAAASVEARVAADPALAEQARAHRALGAGLRGVFDPVMAAPPPDHFDTAPIDLAEARERLRQWRPNGLPQWAAIAATLVLGVGLGTAIGGRSAIGGRGNTSPTAIEGGHMVAAAGLSQALDRQLASTDQANAATRIGLTFRNHDGALCRSFDGREGAGLACRAGDQWQVEALFGPGGASGGDYRAASGGNPRLGALVDETIAGDPLDAAGERAAQAGGWR